MHKPPTVQKPGTKDPARCGAALRRGVAPPRPEDSPSLHPQRSPALHLLISLPKPPARTWRPRSPPAEGAPTPTLPVGLSVAPTLRVRSSTHTAASGSPPCAPPLRAGSYSPAPIPTATAARFPGSHRHPAPGLQPREPLAGKVRSPPPAPFKALAPLGQGGRRHFQTGAGAGCVALYGKDARE